MQMQKYQEIQDRRWQRNAAKRRKWVPPESEEENAPSGGRTFTSDSADPGWIEDPTNPPGFSGGIWTGTSLNTSSTTINIETDCDGTRTDSSGIIYVPHTVHYDTTTSSGTRSDLIDAAIYAYRHIHTYDNTTNHENSGNIIIGGDFNQEAWERATKRRKLKEQLIEPTPKNHHGELARAVSRSANFSNLSPQEIVALQLLKSMLTPQEWRRYLQHGFIVAQGKSGLRYQIIRKQSHVRVFRQGVKLAELCVSGQYDLPPTDRVIARKIIVECNEQDIWHRANIYAKTDQLTPWDKRKEVTDGELERLAA